MGYFIPDNLMPAVKELPKVLAWIKNLRVEGNGVTFKNTPGGATISINMPKQGAGVDGKRAILDIRYNTTTHWIQAAYVANPAEEDWEDKIQFTICPGISVAEFGAF